MTNPTIPTPQPDDNICPCCGETLAFIGLQEYPAKYNRPSRRLVECTNLDCNLYGTTGTINDLLHHCQTTPLAPCGRGAGDEGAS